MNEEWYLLDEREGRVAVLLDAAGRPCRVPARQVPDGIPDGTVLRWDDAAQCYRPDPAETARRQAAMRQKLRHILG